MLKKRMQGRGNESIIFQMGKDKKKNKKILYIQVVQYLLV